MMKVFRVALLVLVLGSAIWGYATWKAKAWDFKTRFTVIDLGMPLTVRSFDPVTNSGIELVIPDNMMLDTVGGRGGVRAKVLVKASDNWGRKWAADSLADYLGTVYIGVEGKMTLLDNVLWWWVRRNGDWQTFDLGKTDYVVSATDPDGVALLRLSERWPEKAEDWFLSTSLTRERINLSIINSTEVGGLGAHIARTIENAGIRVVSVGNDAGEVGRCKVIANLDQSKSLTVAWLTKNFDCDLAIKEGDSDVKMVVGKDYKKWWLGE